MAKKIEINENWEPVEIEDLDNLFVVIFKQGSFEQGYIEAFDTNDVLMQSAYDSLAKQYDDCGCDELTKIYLIKVPNTKQTVDMCNAGLFNGNCCDPHVIEATRELFNRADCEQISCWEGCGLTEAKKKKKRNKNKVIIPGGYLTVTTGDPVLNIKHFNNRMGTGGLQNPDAPHLVVGDTLPNGPIADAGSSDASSGESGGESGGMGESLEEKNEKSLTEAHFDYLKQVAKMRQLEAGTRGFNAASASLDKILYNYDICIAQNLPKARKAMEDALRAHGWDSYIKPTKKQVNISDYDYALKIGYLNSHTARHVLAKKDNVQELIKECEKGDGLGSLLSALAIALGLKNAALAGAIKDYIIDNFTVTLTELKDFLNKHLNNSTFLSELNQVILDGRKMLKENIQLDEAKRYVKRYYVRPLNIFCGNKEDIIQALIRAGDQNCSVYSLKNLTDHEDVHLLQPSDIIYYWDDRVLYDKNHVQVMDYDLFVKHEEERKKVGNIDAVSDATFSAIYDDRATEDDLKDKDVIANYKALNKISR